MISNVEGFTPDWVSPPGDTIVDLMEERDWNQVELANRLGLSTKHLNQLIKGKVALTNETALRLERVLGSSVSFWMSRESKFRQHQARLEAESNYVNWVSWLDELPLGDLKKIGLIEDVRISSSIKPQLVEKLLGFFGVASPADWENHYGSLTPSYRRSKEEQADMGAIATWLRLGEIEAEKISAPKFNKGKFETAVKKIRELTVLPPEEFQPKLNELCLQAGVKFILVKSIPKAHVSGVARWLNGHSPIIQLSLYGKTNDKFWFTFFHEAAHILLHAEEKKTIYLDDVDFQSKSDQETEANEWASNILIPDAYKYDLLDLRYENQIIEFSKKINIHPGIVVGRLQHEHQIKYGTSLDNLKESFNVISE